MYVCCVYQRGCVRWSYRLASSLCKPHQRKMSTQMPIQVHVHVYIHVSTCTLYTSMYMYMYTHTSLVTSPLCRWLMYACIIIQYMSYTPHTPSIIIQVYIQYMILYTHVLYSCILHMHIYYTQVNICTCFYTYTWIYMYMWSTVCWYT